MTHESLAALLQPQRSTEIDAATEILRMLTATRAEPAVRCRADGGPVSGHA